MRTTMATAPTTARALRTLMFVPDLKWRTKYFIDKYVLEGNFIQGETPNMTSDAVCYDKYRYKRPSNFLLLVFFENVREIIRLKQLARSIY